MAINKYLDVTEPFLPEIPGHSNYRLEALPFKGIIKKHPYDSKKVLLYVDSDSRRVLEFYIENILHIDSEAAITGENGVMARELTVWIKKGSVGVELRPFLVGKE
ncbi:hypothetical protein WKV44_05165 [Spirochaetia bacterium 38H-sp]|uniref:Uncharacterized protein n=1 Tax=Rarispira pelagica TaxID=3141764 RepID=A0ABU9UB92_9SPIR